MAMKAGRPPLLRPFSSTTGLITLSVSLDPKDSVIMTFTCNSKFGSRSRGFNSHQHLVMYGSTHTLKVLVNTHKGVALS